MTHLLQRLSLLGLIGITCLATGAGVTDTRAADTPADGTPAAPTSAEQLPGLLGRPAPQIDLPTRDGKRVKLSDQRGKVVLIDFWATWCPPCRAALPRFQAIATDKALAKQGLVTWGINVSDQPAKVTQLVEQKGYTFTIPVDADADVMNTYGLDALPTTLVIGRDGTILYASNSAMDNDETTAELRKVIDKALAKKP